MRGDRIPNARLLPLVAWLLLPYSFQFIPVQRCLAIHLPAENTEQFLYFTFRTQILLYFQRNTIALYHVPKNSYASQIPGTIRVQKEIHGRNIEAAVPPFCLVNASSKIGTRAPLLCFQGAYMPCSARATGISGGTHKTGTRDRASKAKAVPWGPGVSLARLTPATSTQGWYCAIASTTASAGLPSLTMQRTGKRSPGWMPNSASVVAQGFRKAEASAEPRA